ncbi:hypothetical protein [Pseudocitrobacter vendiensis]|uniref:Helix-turn-helix domain-containing protein n=1 Tax=Pseudocitrobacter vendiensis TaxID=2488306 RepID=A0ABN8TGQ0_9ENTR|nr:hypothetical protein [Pseudocitrobacter vendiensis]CAH6662021.1 hypothetical protein FBBNIHIM_23215 [Pseudocitrobacter vendiensis]
MKENLLGYMLGSEFLILIDRSILIPLEANKSSPVQFRPTMFRLLIYLIENASIEPVHDDDIMRNVWEIHGLRASKPRLWQVMNNMGKKMGLKEGISELFLRIENTGYLVNKDNIKYIYVREFPNELMGDYIPKGTLIERSNYSQ